MKTKITVHLINGQTLEYEENYFMSERLMKVMNDGNGNLEIPNYIVPKSNIYYIEYKDVEREENNNEK